MRRLVIAVTVTACGRLGFDEGSPSPGDASSVPGIPNLCDARVVGTLGLTGTLPTTMRATALSSGHAVAVETTGLFVHMMRLDAAGEVIATTLPFDGYSVHGISQISDRPFLYVFNGATGYHKGLFPDWASYDTLASGEPVAMDPQQAALPGQATSVFGAVENGQLLLRTIDVDNLQGPNIDSATPAAFASLGSTPSGVRVVAGFAGECTTFTVTGAGTVSPKHQITPCTEPRLATLGELGAIIYQTSPGGPLAVHLIPSEVGDAGTTIILETGSAPRIATIDGAFWVAYRRDNGEVRLYRLVGSEVTKRDFTGVPGVFELLPTGMFWISPAGELRAASPCL